MQLKYFFIIILMLWNSSCDKLNKSSLIYNEDAKSDTNAVFSFTSKKCPNVDFVSEFDSLHQQINKLSTNQKTTQDENELLSRLIFLCECDYSKACYLISMVYDVGVGKIAPNARNKRMYLQKSCKLGDTFACLVLDKEK